MVTPATPTSDSPPWGACTGRVVPGLVGSEAKLVVVMYGRYNVQNLVSAPSWEAIKTYLEEQYMAVRFGGGFMAPSCFLEQTSHVHIEFF